MFEVEEVLNKYITKTNERMHEILKTDSESMSEVMDWVLSNNGKQLRPKIMILCSMMGKRTVDVSEYAAAIEIMHMASLIHDDIVDNSDYRRGVYSVRKKFGSKMAVYAGDFMIFSICRLINSDNINTYRRMYNKLQSLCEGELGQNDNLFNTNITIDTYLRNIHGKTAVMFEAACYIGSKEGGCSNKVALYAENFGKNYGMLFQIRDDILDLKSNYEVEGKPIMQDWQNGIYTLPILIAMEDNNIKKRLEACFSTAHIKNGVDNQIIDILEKADAFKRCLPYIENYKNEAMQALAKLPDNWAKDVLNIMMNEICDSLSEECNINL